MSNMVGLGCIKGRNKWPPPVLPLVQSPPPAKPLQVIAKFEGKGRLIDAGIETCDPVTEVVREVKAGASGKQATHGKVGASGKQATHGKVVTQAPGLTRYIFSPHPLSVMRTE
jgi:hypothetical protein